MTALALALAAMMITLAPTTATQSVPLDLITARWTGDLDGMVARRRIRILTPYGPAHYFVDGGVPRGIIQDAGMALERTINAKWKTTPASWVHVVMVPTPRAELFRALSEGRGDIAASNLAVTRDPSASVEFTRPGRTGVRRIVVTDLHGPALHTVADLSGRDVVVREHSEDAVDLRQINDTLIDSGKQPIRITTVPSSIEDEELLEMVDRGLIQASVVDDFVASFWARTYRGVRLQPRAVVRDNISVAWAVRTGSPNLLEELNAFLLVHGPITRFGQDTFGRYQRTASAVQQVTRGAAWHRFAALAGLFRKYADRYELDPLLMIAQGYEESRLRQSARSAAGAIGIMQLMPNTARELSVGDIHQTEANVHAGVKYFRRIIDRYFAEPSLDEFNRSMFAFAAYNCGPTRVRRLRNEARRRGLNPNLWFGHVEIVAGERVGDETVRYVSNIYKYYVAYSLAAAHGRADR